MKSNRTLVLVFLMLGILALVVGIVELKKQKTYSPTEGVITRIEEEEYWENDKLEINYHTYVSYSVDGVDYEGALGYYEDGYEEGKTITVKYNPENPAQVTGDAKGFAIYLVIIGPVLLVAAVLTVLKKGF